VDYTSRDDPLINLAQEFTWSLQKGFVFTSSLHSASTQGRKIRRVNEARLIRRENKKQGGLM
jgi:hypothetical protein